MLVLQGRLGLPNSRTGMTAALWEGEQHDVIVSLMSNRSVVRPIIGQVVHELPIWAVHHGLTDWAIGVVRRGDDLDKWPVLVEAVRVALPFVEIGLKELCDFLITLQQRKRYRSSKPIIPISVLKLLIIFIHFWYDGALSRLLVPYFMLLLLLDHVRG